MCIRDSDSLDSVLSPTRGQVRCACSRAGQAMERSRLRWLATEPGRGRTCTIPSEMSTTWATAWVRDEPTMIQAPSVIFRGTLRLVEETPRQSRVILAVQVDRQVDGSGVHLSGCRAANVTFGVRKVPTTLMRGV